MTKTATLPLKTKSGDSTMYKLLCDLHPLHRTINSDDMEKSLKMIGAYIGGNYKLHHYEPGTPAFTWHVPYRYYVDEAYIEWNGKKFSHFAENNLSVVSYSIPVDKTVSYEELREHVYTSQVQPDEIPWIFKYYEKTWGFCMKLSEWKTFDPKGTYRVVIRSRFEKKPFAIGEFVLPGKAKEELLWVSDVCHPNQVNDSISGAVVAADLARELKKNMTATTQFGFYFCRRRSDLSSGFRGTKTRFLKSNAECSAKWWAIQTVFC